MHPQQNKLKAAIKQLIGLSIVSTQVSFAGDIFTVTNDSDTPSMGEITLREAINLANATSGATIEFDPVFFAEPKTIELTQGELLIQSSITLQGSGADLITVDGMNNSRILTISNEDSSL